MGIRQTFTTLVMGLLSSNLYAAQDIEIYEEAECLAQNIYFEARNQPLVGKIAIGNVTLNRVKSEHYPNTICEVIRQGTAPKCQFSWWCDGKSDTPTEPGEIEEAREIALKILANTYFDVTEGALWYHADYIIKPSWARRLKEKVQINDHIFYTTN